MKVTGNSEQQAEELMRAFNGQYLYLRMEYCDTRHHKSPITDSSYLSGLSVHAGYHENEGIAVDFSEHIIVRDLVRAVWMNLGIHIRIFRKFGKAWLPILLTTGWTLKLQNEQGRAFSSPD